MSGETKVRLICGNCGTEGRFTSWDEAFVDGWDTIERFGYNACDKCPGVSVYFPMLYAQEAKQFPTGSSENVALLDKAAEATMEFENKSVQDLINDLPEGALEKTKEFSDAIAAGNTKLAEKLLAEIQELKGKMA